MCESENYIERFFEIFPEPKWDNLEIETPCESCDFEGCEYVCMECGNC